ncbi:MAG: transcription termination/antitermination factor NusG [Candidatus Sumerlaeia bacterium]|nr:transcription termination/antitermination factor NusG [Candidatus Sumerlaeia bacterium]
MATWYVLHTYSGYENKVRSAIDHRAAVEGFRDKIRQVVVPQENVIEIRGGKKRTITRTLIPGYVLLDMDYDDDIAGAITKIPGVSGFLGDGKNPFPMSEEDVANLLHYADDSVDRPKPEIRYRVGEQVKVIEGPFANFIGTVDEIDAEKAKLRVMVSIFGRPTPVELDVLQVEGV